MSREDAFRVAGLEYLKREDYWQEKWDGEEDIVYTLAVFLDSIASPWLNIIGKPEFKIHPQFIYEDFPLTDLLIPLLETKAPIRNLIPLLKTYIKGANNQEGEMAILSGLIVDSVGFFPDLENLLNTSSSKTREKVVAFLARRYQDIRGVIQLQADDKKIWQLDLNPSENQEADSILIFNWLIETIAKSGKLPKMPPYADKDTLGGYGHNTYNAEFYANWLLAYEDGYKYNFAVILDVLGKELDSLSIMPAIHKSQLKNFDWFTKWGVEPIPPNYHQVDIEEQWTDMCNLFLNSNFGDFEEDLAPPGLLIYHREREALKLKGAFRDDLYCLYLLVNKKTQKGIIDNMDSITEDFPTLIELIQRVQKEPNMLRRARRFYWLAQYTEFVSGIHINLFQQACATAFQIKKSAYCRFRAVERLLNIAPLYELEHLWKRAYDFCLEIPDPNNRARGLARLSRFIVDEENKKHLYNEIIANLLKIKEVENRNIAFNELKPVLISSEEYSKVKSSILKNSNLREKFTILNLSSLNIINTKYHTTGWTPLIISSFCNQIERFFNQEKDINLDWQFLLKDEFEGSKEFILDRLVAGKWELIKLSTDLLSVINSLLDKTISAHIHPLLPYIEPLHKGSSSTIFRWMDSTDTYLAQYAALYLIELGVMNKKIIEKIEAILVDGDDIGRYRASMALHGPKVFIGNPDFQWRTSMIGLESLLALARLYEKLRKYNMGKSNIIRWTWMNIVHDSEMIMRKLIEKAQEKRKDEQLAIKIINEICLLMPSAANPFFNVFKSNNISLMKETQYALLKMTSQNNFDVPELNDQQLKGYEQHEEILNEVGVSIPDRQNNILATIQSCSEDSSNEVINLSKRVEEAEAAIQALLTTNSPNSMVYQVGDDANRSAGVAKSLIEKGIYIELLFGWIKFRTQQKNKERWESFLNATLLEIASFVAKESPATTINLLRELDLSNNLTQAFKNESWFFGRLSALFLIGYLEKMPAELPQLLRLAFEDIGDVQVVALEMIQNIRNVDQTLIDPLLEMLNDKNASIAYTAAKILTTIGRNEKTSKDNRQKILKELSIIVENKDAKKGIFTLKKFGKGVTEGYNLDYIGQLDQALYQNIIEIMGIA